MIFKEVLNFPIVLNVALKSFNNYTNKNSGNHCKFCAHPNHSFDFFKKADFSQLPFNFLGRRIAHLSFHTSSNSCFQISELSFQFLIPFISLYLQMKTWGSPAGPRAPRNTLNIFCPSLKKTKKKSNDLLLMHVSV